MPVLPRGMPQQEDRDRPNWQAATLQVAADILAHLHLVMVHPPVLAHRPDTVAHVVVQVAHAVPEDSPAAAQEAVAEALMEVVADAKERIYWAGFFSPILCLLHKKTS